MRDMTTLIAVYGSNGCVGRCDANCYQATSDNCRCVCGGRNHGAGERQAIENIKEHYAQMLEEYQTQHTDERIEECWVGGGNRFSSKQKRLF